MVTTVSHNFWKCIDGMEFPEAQESAAHRHDAQVHILRAWTKTPYTSSQDPLKRFVLHFHDAEHVPTDVLLELVDACEAEMRARNVINGLKKQKECKGG